jgi:hypothetical protein
MAKHSTSNKFLFFVSSILVDLTSGLFLVLDRLAGVDPPKPAPILRWLLDIKMFGMDIDAQTSPIEERTRILKRFQQGWLDVEQGKYRSAYVLWRILIKDRRFENSVVLHNNIARLYFERSKNQSLGSDRKRLELMAQTEIKRAMTLLPKRLAKFSSLQRPQVESIVKHNYRRILPTDA